MKTEKIKMNMKKTPNTTWLRQSIVTPLILLSMIMFLSNCSENEIKPVVEFQQVPGKLMISIGGEPFATYIYEDPEISRPYFAHVNTPCGIQATRNHPPQPDDSQDHRIFHPGVWLSYGDLNGYDYWRLRQRVEHELFVKQPEGGPGKGTFTVRNYYMDAEGTTRVLAELVEYTVLVRPSGYLLLWDITYSSNENDITFGDQTEMGLAMRVNTKISVQYGLGNITNAEGMKDEAGTWSKQSNWIDYSGRIDDTYVGMAIMPDPNNFRRSRYHARDYGFVAANPFAHQGFFEEEEKSSVTIPMGEEFHLGYGLLVYCNPSGRMPDIENAYRDYLNVLNELKK